MAAGKSLTDTIRSLDDWTLTVQARDIDKRLSGTEKGVYGWHLPPTFPQTVTDAREKSQNFYQGIREEMSRERGQSKRHTLEISKRAFPAIDISLLEQPALRHFPTLALASFCFSPPIYVGKAHGAEGIKQRLNQERKDKAFRSRINTAAIDAGVSALLDVDALIIKYVDLAGYFDQQNINLSNVEFDRICKLTELMVFWQQFPPLNSKQGN
jgi:hypothetical protein